MCKTLNCYQIGAKPRVNASLQNILQTMVRGMPIIVEDVRRIAAD